MNINLNQLWVFHAVAKSRGFTRAASDLCLTQPGISKHIKQLEEYYGVQLFDRLGKKVLPTQAGELLLEATTEVFRLLDNAKVKIYDLGEMTAGRITIGASFTAGTYLLPEIIGQFNQQYKGVELLLDISLSDRIAEKVISNDLDIGFIGAPYEDERLINRRFYDDTLVVILPKGHPWQNRKAIRLAELTDQPFVYSIKGSGTRTVIQEKLNNAGVKLQKVIEFGNTETVKKAVVAGIGISILSEAVIRNEVASGQMCAIPLDEGGITRTFFMVFHKDKYRTKATSALIEMVDAFVDNKGNRGHC
ncbi:MAG: LysR family transcriptional regulator [Deltaproteobacteria bacterium]|nr:LysR family transcriptional regulator [Deltaproteobacteria bacterium]